MSSTATAMPAHRQEEGAPEMGAFALPAPAEALRRLAGCIGSGPIARRGVSLLRRAALLGRADPVDAEVFASGRGRGVWARLHPRDNLSEKRAFAGTQFWDAAERQALTTAIAAHQGPAPFVFVDAGANAGLYSLAAIAAAERAGKALCVVAIEPEPETVARLSFNLAAAARRTVEATVIEAAVAAAPGRLVISTPGRNRGEVRASVNGTGRGVEALPLLEVTTRAGLERIDALKIDIEGMEAPVLSAFLAAAPPALHPRLVILEALPQPARATGEGRTETAALALLREAGYSVAGRTRLNAILRRAPRPMSGAGEDDDMQGAARAAGRAAADAGADLGG
ncbi:MAG: FkbM family methyltransferase [Pseudomonadota bacterium]